MNSPPSVPQARAEKRLTLIDGGLAEGRLQLPPLDAVSQVVDVGRHGILPTSDERT